MIEFPLDAAVLCLDGRAGKLAGVVIDPQGRRPTSLIVRQDRLPRREVVVSASLVIDVTPAGIRLDVTGEVLETFPDYQVTVRAGEYRGPMAVSKLRAVASTPVIDRGYAVLRQRAVPEQSVEVRRGMAVRDCDGEPVGTVEGMMADPQRRECRHLVVRRSPQPADTRLIPIELVADIRGDAIHLQIASAHVDGLAARETA